MNTRFAVSIHILTFLYSQKGQPVPSETIAQSVNTNPALIRRLLQMLNRAGLTKAQMGANGGALLAKSGESINLLDVFKATQQDENLLGIHDKTNPNCPLGRNIGKKLGGIFNEAESKLFENLQKTTIKTLTEEIAADLK